MNWKQSLISGATVLTLGSLSLLSGDNEVHASEVEIVPITSEIEGVPGTSVVQNDDSSDDSSDISYTPESEVWIDGEYLGNIVVEEEMVFTTSRLYTHTRKNIQNKNYNIHYISGAANVGFGITVKNKRITKAYDPWANGIGYSVTNKDLTYNAKQATLPGVFNVFFKGFPLGSTFRLKATIDGSKLVTTLDVP